MENRAKYPPNTHTLSLPIFTFRCVSKRMNLILEKSITHHSKDKVKILNVAAVQPKYSGLRMAAASEVRCIGVDVNN